MTWNHDGILEDSCYSWLSLTTWHYHLVTRWTTKGKLQKECMLRKYESVHNQTNHRPTTSLMFSTPKMLSTPKKKKKKKKKRNRKKKKKNQHLQNYSILTILINAWKSGTKKLRSNWSTEMLRSSSRGTPLLCLVSQLIRQWHMILHDFCCLPASVDPTSSKIMALSLSLLPKLTVIYKEDQIQQWRHIKRYLL